METLPGGEFAVLLRRYRIAAGLSQEALAERSGLSVRAISDLERGARRVPYRETVRLLGEALALPAADRVALEAAVDRERGPRTPGLAHAQKFHPSLPAPVTPLIGRDEAVVEVSAWLTDGTARLVTLTGPPGIGKTRLALAVSARAAIDYPGGVFFVGLAPLTNPRLVPTSIMQALGLDESGGRTATERLRDVLHARRALLLLDNFEHVVDAAPLIGTLLETCPRVAVLATSRVPLRLRSEHEFPVPPLALPDHAVDVQPAAVTAIGDVPAVALFVERARAVTPAFSLTPDNARAVAEICRALDGLPLAIELAAARCKVLTPQAIATRLGHRLDLLTGGARDAPERHRTLRAAVAWSHDLLSPAESVLFRRLAVFRGGFTLDAAEAVAGKGGEVVEAGEGGVVFPHRLTPSPAGHSLLPPQPPSPPFVDGIAALVDHSLVTQGAGVDGEPRFSMLETLREYAAEQLLAAGEQERLEAAHAADLLSLAEEIEPQLFSGDRGRWISRLNEEQDNIRSALAWALAQDDPEPGLRLVGALWLWFLRHLLIEGRRWADDLLAHPGALVPTTARASALFVAGHLAWLQGDVSAMRTRLEESVAIMRRLGDRIGLGRALPFLGLALGEDQAVAQHLAEEGVAYCRETGDRCALAIALTNLGRIAATWGDHGAAHAALEEAVGLFRAIDDGWLVALPLTSIGALSYRAGDYSAARAAFDAALPCFRAVEDRRNTTLVLTNLGYVALAERNVDQAGRIFAESLAFGREHGDRFNAPACLRGIALVAAARGDTGRAARFAVVAHELAGATGAPRWPAERLGGPHATEDLRARLGDDAFAAESLAGQQPAADAVIDDALNVAQNRH